MQLAPQPQTKSEIGNRQLLALREATLAITSDLSLKDTLKRVVVAAAKLVNARYAALGVPDDTGETLVEFVTTGLTAQEEARISHYPKGHGILGLILREGKSLRLKDLRQHPLSAGFPPNHPPMTSFLGVPIIQKGHQVGNLYLTDKFGGEEFTEDDQAIIELLASQASVALQNARLYQSVVQHSTELEDRNRELAAINAVATVISEHLDLNRVMVEALDHVLSVTGAEVGEIFLLDETTDELVLALHRGPFHEIFQSTTHFKRGEGLPGAVAASGHAVLADDLTTDSRLSRPMILKAGFHSYVSIPLIAKGKVLGTLDLAARKPKAFDADGIAVLESIGNQIGIAVENAQLYRQVAKLAVVEERQRIGMDLHDGIIQSIYGVGLMLEYVGAQIKDGETTDASDRLKQAIDALNNTIRDIRAYILDLRPRRFEGDDLIVGLRRLIAEFKANTLIAVDLTADEAADEALTPEARLALFHIAQEALSNAAKHSHATNIAVKLITNKENIILSLKDNGRGFDPNQVEQRVGHGLMNMHDRALAIGGHVSVGANGGLGTEVRVALPRWENK